jgi:hypothetical protein
MTEEPGNRPPEAPEADAGEQPTPDTASGRFKRLAAAFAVVGTFFGPLLSLKDAGLDRRAAWAVSLLVFALLFCAVYYPRRRSPAEPQPSLARRAIPLAVALCVVTLSGVIAWPEVFRSGAGAEPVVAHHADPPHSPLPTTASAPTTATNGPPAEAPSSTSTGPADAATADTSAGAGTGGRGTAGGTFADPAAGTTGDGSGGSSGLRGSGASGGSGTSPQVPPSATTTSAKATVRYTGSFSLDVSHEAYDLDQIPPQAYGPNNTLAVGDDSIDVVVPNGAKGAYWTAQQAPTRRQCQDAVARTNPSVDSFTAPRPGLMFCVMTYGGRYGFVRVNSAAPKNYDITATIWE